MNTIQSLDAFTKAYLVAALWSSTGEDSEPLDKSFNVNDYSQEAIDKAVTECAAFRSANDTRLVAANIDEKEAGHCFWLSRAGHGSGYFDCKDHRSPDIECAACNELQKAAQKVGNLDLYPGDDGRLYFT